MWHVLETAGMEVERAVLTVLVRGSCLRGSEEHGRGSCRAAGATGNVVPSSPPGAVDGIGPWEAPAIPVLTTSLEQTSLHSSVG